MVNTLVKAVVVILFTGGFFYCANLAFQGELSMERVVVDSQQLWAFVQMFFAS